MRKKKTLPKGSFLPLLFLIIATTGNTTYSKNQSPEARVLFIEGGTIVDATSAAPRSNVSILIQDGRITEIQEAAKTSAPAGAEVIDARDKFIIPGLFDAHVHYYDYMPPIFIAHGVTSVMLVGGPVEWEVAVKGATNRGDIVGPRIFHSGNNLGMPSSAFAHAVPLKNYEEARRATRELIQKGVDYVKLQIAATPEVARGIVEEAHGAGKPVIAHLGPHIDAEQAAKIGIDQIAHGTGIARATIKDPALKKQAQSVPKFVGEPVSLMQPELYRELIDLLIREEVTLEPDLVYVANGIHPLSAEFNLENLMLFSNVELRFVPENALRRWFLNFPPWDGEDRETLQKGYQKLVSFYRQFVKAGGQLVIGSDTSGVPPGISVHQEMELLVHEGILSPQQAIEAATRLPAEFVGRNRDLGTIEKGKIADLVILNSNPLEDIRNTRHIFAVIKEGQVVDRTYHRYFTNPVLRPFPEAGGEFRTPRIESVTPDAISCAETKVLTIRGSGFAPQSWVKVDGVGYDITFVSSAEIRTEVDCQAFAFSGTHSLVVVNPKPIKGFQSDVSNEVRFVVVK